MDGFSRQTPRGAEIFLDHVGWFIADMDGASRAFERLGFVLTPFVVSRNADPAGGPSKPSGTGNRCAMLERGYLELITSIDGVDTPLARQHREAVGRHVGLHVLAFTVADPGAAYARLKAEGFEPGDPVKLRRPITAPDGSDALAAFTVIRVPPEKMTEGRIQILAQETPELIWQKPLIAKTSGISGLSGALVCVDDPANAARRYARFLGRPSAGDDGLQVIGLDRGVIGFANPVRCRELIGNVPLPAPPVIAAVSFQSADLVRTEKYLSGNGVGVVRAEDGSLRVGPGEGLGAVMVIHGTEATWPGAASAPR